MLVAAHGNSIRGIIKHLSNIGDQEIVGVEIPTGQPLVYELNDDLSVSDRYYLSERRRLGRDRLFAIHRHGRRGP